MSTMFAQKAYKNLALDIAYPHGWQDHMSHVIASLENLLFTYAITKVRNSCVVPMQLISAFVSYYIDSTFPLLPKSEISSLWPLSVAVQPRLCWT